MTTVTPTQQGTVSDDVRIKYATCHGDEIVNRVIDRMNTTFKPKIPHNEKGTKLLTIQILQCTEGSRWGRICCGELGLGWIVLEIDWKLTSYVPQDEGKILVDGKRKLRDSGAIGCVDMCEDDLGEKTLDEMASRLALQIIRDCHHVLTNIGK